MGMKLVMIVMGRPMTPISPIVHMYAGRTDARQRTTWGIDRRKNHRIPKKRIPWTSPETYDVDVAGQSNAGHAVQFDARTEEQKRALLEYLKLL